MARRLPARHLRRAAVVLACAVAAIATACERGDTAGPTLPESTFVSVIVDLRRAAAAAQSPEEYRAERERILADANVTDSALVEFVRVHGDQPHRMAAIWDSIAARLRPPPTDTMAQ